jgi:hypothetical protein
MGINITKANPFIARLFKDNETAKKKYPKKVVISVNSGGKFMVVSSGSAKTLNRVFSKSSNEHGIPRFAGVDH